MAFTRFGVMRLLSFLDSLSFAEVGRQPVGVPFAVTLAVAGCDDGDANERPFAAMGGAAFCIVSGGHVVLLGGRLGGSALPASSAGVCSGQRGPTT